MGDYSEGEMLLTINVKETFVLEIEQHGETTEMVTGVGTLNSSLVTRMELREYGGRENFHWEDQMRIENIVLGGEYFRMRIGILEIITTQSAV